MMIRSRTAFTVEPRVLWQLAGEAMATLFRDAPGFSAHVTPHAALILTGEPIADLNYAIVDGGVEAASLLTHFTETSRGRKLPLIVMLSDTVAGSLASTAEGLSLQYAARLPLMTLDASAVLPDIEGYTTTTVTDRDGLARSNRLMADAFSLPQPSVDRTMTATLLGKPGVDLFMLSDGATGMSSLCTTRVGEVVGIWSMATPPQHQRKGAGRAALTSALRYHADRGATLFYLIATDAGRPLYERLGFRAVAEAVVWVDGHSTQAPVAV
jgi:GNAT superfamily N-acetyltransferase